ncbi:hypothetical protein IPL68_03695 [Candidatus Saccharibacteria bacterium]|nr:MAG: hypothetical protein IPL68_03695 [Candidatus Saccharibacteria bacterium]
MLRIRTVAISSLAVIVLLGIGAIVYDRLRSEPPIKPDDTTSPQQVTYSADIQAQIAAGKQYPEGSYEWTNAMLNAAVYAANHRLCSQATDLLDTVQNVENKDGAGVDIGVVKERIDASCQA